MTILDLDASSSPAACVLIWMRRPGRAPDGWSGSRSGRSPCGRSLVGSVARSSWTGCSRPTSPPWPRRRRWTLAGTSTWPCVAASRSPRSGSTGCAPGVDGQLHRAACDQGCRRRRGRDAVRRGRARTPDGHRVRPSAEEPADPGCGAGVELRSAHTPDQNPEAVSGRHLRGGTDQAELAAARSRPRWYHLRDKGGRHEIDLVIEYGGGRVAGLEIKARATPTSHDARHLEWLREMLGERFVCGVVLHTGPQAFRLSERVFAAPIGTLWA